MGLLTVKRTSRGEVPLQNVSTPSFTSISLAQSSIPLYCEPTRCILVLMLSNGMDAYLRIGAVSTHTPSSYVLILTL